MVVSTHATPAPARSDDGNGLGSFARAVFLHRRGAVGFMVLAVALAAVEWIGLLLLLPVLASAGVRDASGDTGALVERITQLLSALGVTPRLLPVLFLFLALVVVRAVMQRQSTVLAIRVEQEFVLALRERLHAAVARMEWVPYARQRQSEVFHALTAELARVAHAASYLLRLTVTATVALAYLAVALRLSPITTLLAGLAGLLLVVALRHTNGRAHEAGEAVSDADATLYATVESQLSGMKTARSFGVVEQNVSHFREMARAMASAELLAVRNHATSDAAFAIGSAVLLTAIVVAAVRLLAVPTAALLLLVLIFSRLAPQFASTRQAYQFLVGALPSYGRVMRLIAMCEASVPRPEPLQSAAEAPSGSIHFRDVSFRYVAGSDESTLTGITLDIPVGRTTALVGMTGAGKSTIADLALGLIAPDSGSIDIGGSSLTAAVAAAWRSRIGVVLQDAFLLQGSVRENLLWVAPDADDDALRHALEQAHALRFVERLPHGLDTRIGDRGVLLSGGERQRLSLARALLRKPRLLVLDEPTSAVDGETEAVIHDAISALAGATTVLIISHRLSTIRHADVIHVIEGGRLIQSGTWPALIADDGGRFRAMCRAQGLLES